MGIDRDEAKSSVRSRCSPLLRRDSRVALSLCLVLSAACVSQAGRSPDHARLAGVLAQLPPQELVKLARPSSAKGYRLHVAGLVECGGFLKRTQTIYAEAWMTRLEADGSPDADGAEAGEAAPSKDPERVAALKLDLRATYLGGLFEGLRKKKIAERAESIVLSNVIHGNPNTEICDCVRFVANADAPPFGEKLRAQIVVCPDS